ncbi:MAG: DUF63 family protein [Methanoregula sp.]
MPRLLSSAESHTRGGALIAWTGTAFSMVPIKIFIPFPTIYFLRQYRKEAQPILWHRVLFTMIVVGPAPGVRDMVSRVLFV